MCASIHQLMGVWVVPLFAYLNPAAVNIHVQVLTPRKKIPARKCSMRLIGPKFIIRVQQHCLQGPHPSSIAGRSHSLELPPRTVLQRPPTEWALVGELLGWKFDQWAEDLPHSIRAVKSHLHLLKSNLFFLVCAFRVTYKKSLPDPRS